MFTIENDRYTRYIARFIAMSLAFAILCLSLYRSSYRPMSKMEIARIVLEEAASSPSGMRVQDAKAEIEKRTKEKQQEQQGEWGELKVLAYDLPVVTVSTCFPSPRASLVSFYPAAIAGKGFTDVPAKPPAC